MIAAAIFILLYPGTWSWDDVLILEMAENYELNPWQHVITSIFYILCLETIPIAGGVPLVQIMIASFIAGYIPVTVSEIVPVKRKWVVEVLVLLSTLSPPLLTHLYSGFRMGICCYLETLLCVLLIYYAKEGISRKALCGISALTVLVSAWRTENGYYVILLSILLVYRFWKAGKVRRIEGLIAVALCGTLVILINRYNTYRVGTDDYLLYSTLFPMQCLIVKDELTKEEEVAVDRVIDVDVIRKYPDYNPLYLCTFDDGALRKGYTKEDLNGYLSAYIHSAIKHPVTVLRMMWHMFCRSAGVVCEDGKTLQRTPALNSVGSAYDIYKPDTASSFDITFLNVDVPLKYPIDEGLRIAVIRFLQCVDDQDRCTAPYFLFWNVLFSFIFAIISLIFSLRNKDLMAVFIILSLFGRAAVVFASAEAPYIMYYLSIYLIADVMFIYSSARFMLEGNTLEDAVNKDNEIAEEYL